ncbi:phosphoethanolamine transferase [Albidovulum sediminis]|uniref:Sulfatase-like hydrolase/transferase n=1 Tax=Albidovulum sediminis TaxID=3066345 RepID=A0ABT2NJK1_9RHOB|nr:sulfatase-like hydrolase/transferase [Defluviimonas sediminis]MCT8329094.1 sulfatase-like hydrolase/transferase [Defluviimonas sediminis]
MTDTPRTQRARLARPLLSHLTLNLIVAAYIVAALNLGFWGRMVAAFHGKPVQIGIFGLAIFGLTLFTLELLGPGRLQRPVAALLILMASGASYYERTFGVLIDREMIRNVFETTVTESRHLVTLSAVFRIGLTGVLPAALVFWPRVRRVRRWHHVWRWPVGVGLSLAVIVGGLFTDYKAFSAVLRERKEVMASYQPGATIAALVKFGKEQFAGGDPVARPIAPDAAPGPHLAAAAKPVLLVLFAGETARAQNFGLNGYGRDTTPGLAQREVINFPDVSSCGTSTAVSLPCMFSPLAQADYSRTEFLSRENLLDVLARAGFDVKWVDNNTGDQRIADRIGWERVDPEQTPAVCVGECTDEAFLPLIERTAATMTRNTVLVLHMIGNHGPAYYLRYPEERAVFTPDCRTAEFAECEVESIVNAYDNAMLETDRVLSATIDMLAAADRVLPAMLFLSDHGESLGENGLFLHAAPMFMAPEVQTKVPMVMWMGEGFRDAMKFDEGCLRDAARAPASHDNLFHTVLGLVDVATEARDGALDLTAACRIRIAS